MTQYRVAINAESLLTAPVVEADGPVIAATEYVRDNNMIASTWLVQEMPEPVEVEITIDRTVSGSLVGAGGAPTTRTTTEADTSVPAADLPPEHQAPEA